MFSSLEFEVLSGALVIAGMALLIAVACAIFVTVRHVRNVARQRDSALAEIAGIRARAQASKAERRAIQSVIEREAHGIVNFDREGKIVFVNSGAEKIF
ncbi:MAG: hypothetical protein WD558_05820, partial [Pseudomonadales bacterium]